MKTTSTRRRVEDAALDWSRGLRVEVGGAGTLAQAINGLSTKLPVR